MTTYKNHHVVIPDQVIVYQRARSSLYQARLKHPTENGYIVKSTKKKDLSDAIKTAIKMYGELSYKIERDIEIKEYSFRDLYKLWWETERETKSEARAKYIEGTAKRYLIPFFLKHLQNKKITALNDKDFDNYFKWRKNYWTSQDGQKQLESQTKRTNNKGKYRHSKLGNIAKVPAFKTLQMEQSLLKQIFWFAHRRGIIDRNPYIKAPKPHGMKNMEKSRRPAFTEDEWRIIYTELRSWVKEGIDLKQPRVKGKFASDHLDQTPAKRVNKMHQHQREMCRHYILFMGQSGLRPNEARQMRWRDIKTNPQNRLQYIYVRPTTKTGERDTYPIQSAFNTLDRLRSISRFAEPDDLVFVNYYGKVHTNFGKTFKSFLTDHNLLVDQLGRDRTIYSLRHMYATFRLERGDVSIEALAQNMGTSPKMIYDHYRHITTHRLSEQLVQIAPKENKAELDALN